MAPCHAWPFLVHSIIDQRKSVLNIAEGNRIGDAVDTNKIQKKAQKENFSFAPFLEMKRNIFYAGSGWRIPETAVCKAAPFS